MIHRLDSNLSLVKVEKGTPEEQSDMERATLVLEYLNRHYPNHPWTVSVQGQGIIIRHMMISTLAAAFLRREGFSFLMPRDKMGTPREIAESAMRAGGAMLELFGMRRGSWDGHTAPRIPSDWHRKKTSAFA